MDLVAVVLKLLVSCTLFGYFGNAQFAVSNSVSVVKSSKPTTTPTASPATGTTSSGNDAFASLLAGALAGMMGGGDADGGPGGGTFKDAIAPDELRLAGAAAGALGFMPTTTYRGGGPQVTVHFNKPVSGKGLPSVYTCYQSHLDYSSMSRSYITNATGKPIFTTRTEYSSTMVTNYINESVPTTTKCDGWPRILGETRIPVTLTFQEATMERVSQVFPGPSPQCTIPDTACNLAYSAFDASTFSFLSSTLFEFFAAKKTGKIPTVPFSTLQPPCRRITACPTNTAAESCTLEARKATVFYWPTASPEHLCDSEAPRQRRPQETKTPSTAVFDGFTVTSPSALVILETLSGASASKPTVSPKPSTLYYTSCGNRVNGTLAVGPGSLSSMRDSFTPTYISNTNTRYSASKVPYSFNFEDLNPGAVPWDAYAAARGCNLKSSSDSRCPKTILDNYRPILSLPKEATKLGVDNEFAKCEPQLVRDAMYVPITATTVDLPVTTRYGAPVTVGPRETTIQPAAWIRMVTTDVTPVA